MYMLFGIPRQRNVKETAVVGVMAMHESLGGDRRRCHSVQLAFSKRCLKAQIISLLSASDANTYHHNNHQTIEEKIEYMTKQGLAHASGRQVCQRHGPLEQQP